METFSVLMAICDGNSPVPGELRPVMRIFDVCFDLRLNKSLNKHSWGWWFETLSRPLWRHRNEALKYNQKKTIDTHMNMFYVGYHICFYSRLSSGSVLGVSLMLIRKFDAGFCFCCSIFMFSRSKWVDYLYDKRCSIDQQPFFFIEFSGTPMKS